MTTHINEEAKRIVESWLALQRFANTISADFALAVRRRTRDIKKVAASEDYKKLIVARDKELREELFSMFDQFGLAATAIVGAEATFYGWNKFRVSKAAVTRALNQPMPGVKVTPLQVFNTNLTNMTNKSIGAVTDAVNQGTTIRALQSTLTELGEGDARQMEAFARTATNGVSNASKQELYERNDDVVRGVLWNSVLDSRTSDFCMVHDGLIFPLNEGPRPPAHPNCRSQVVPVLTGETNVAAIRDLSPRPAVVPRSKDFNRGDSKTRTGKIRKPRKGGPLKGTTVTNTTYETWLKQQPVAYQQDILGIKGTKAFRSGDSLKKVITSRNNTLDFSGLEKAIN